ncbi:MAG: HAD family phosphatase [Asgard group archaeon]|nr:HAD family phosphatase [Asgard group archaeon]
MTLITELIKKWNITGIVFDLDGTLVNTLDCHIEAFLELFKELGIAIPYIEIVQNMGRTPKDILLTLIPEIVSQNNKLEIYADRKEELLTKLLENVPVINGAIEILSYLKEINVKMCLASSTPMYNVSKMLEKAKIKEYFEAVVTGEDITIGKPNPEVFLIAAKKINAKPESCIIIGDSPHDIEAGKNARMKAIAVATGKHKIETLRECKPDYLIKTLLELIA